MQQSGRHPDAASARSTIVSLRFASARLAADHDRCRDCAEFVAQVASTGQPDAAMDAREISAGVYELLELIHGHHGDGEVCLEIDRVPHGVEVTAEIPADARLAAVYDGWMSAIEPEGATDMVRFREKVRRPRPIDGLDELSRSHGVLIGLESTSPLVLRMTIPLAGGSDA